MCKHLSNKDLSLLFFVHPLLQELSQTPLRKDLLIFKRLEKYHEPAKEMIKLIANESLPLLLRQQIAAVYEGLKTNISLVHIYFKELGIVKYRRDELYNIMDVIG